MKLNRVVITGVGAISPLGNDVASLMDGLEKGRSAVRFMEGWDQYTGLRSHVAAPAEVKDERAIPRQKRRFMGRMSIFSAQAAEQGMLATIPLVARKGRASYLGERSAGHQDPGATSSHLLLKTAAETWAQAG